MDPYQERLLGLLGDRPPLEVMAETAKLERVADHPERGPESVGLMIRLLAGHDLNHLGQLEEIARA